MATTESIRQGVPKSDVEPHPSMGIADPGPLGLAAFAMTTFVLSVFNANLIDARVSGAVLGLALVYGGIAQLLAGMWEFRRNNTFGALAFSSYGAFWLSFFFYVRYVAPGLPASHAYQATGLFLLAWMIFTMYMTIASLRVSGAVCGVFVTLSVTYLLLMLGAFEQSSGLTKAGGWLGIITAVVAWYTSFAGVTNSTFGKTLIPTWPARRG